jgi:protocatechuate 4,5-dioxygenase beta chain
MAKIVGGMTTSHVPAIGGAMAKGLQNEPYWKPFFDGFLPVRHWLDDVKPDVAVVFYNDHGLNFFLDKMPTFAVGPRRSTTTPTKAGAFPRCRRSGATDLSWHLINQLVAGFDITTCQEMLVDHAFTLPLKLFWPEGDCPVLTVPVCINTVQFPCPAPSAAGPGRGRGRGHRPGTATRRWW